MKEVQVIKELQKLREIRPRKNWVIFTKAKILGETPRVSPFFFLKPVLGSVLALGLIAGFFLVSQKALPSEPLYPIKKLSEKAKIIFVSQEKKAEFQLKLTEKRLAELEKIVKKNDTRKLSSALSELKSSKLSVDKEISKIKETQIIKEIAPIIEKNNTKEKEILSSLGLEVEEEKEPTEKLVAQYLIKDLEKSSLTEKQEKLLEEAKEYLEEGNYSLALSKALEAGQIK